MAPELFGDGDDWDVEVVMTATLWPHLRAGGDLESLGFAQLTPDTDLDFAIVVGPNSSDSWLARNAIAALAYHTPGKLDTYDQTTWHDTSLTPSLWL